MKRAGIAILCLALVGGGYFAYAKVFRRIELPKGTAVNLVLMKSLEAGKDGVGTKVPLMVAEDVVVDGAIAIPKGTIIEGTVTRSRGEDMFSGITNRPARLEVTAGPAFGSEDGAIKLSGDAAKPDGVLSLNRGNTGKQGLAGKLEGLAKDPDVLRALGHLERSFNGQESFDLSDPKMKSALERVANELNMKNLADAVAGGRETEVKGLLDSVSKAGSATRTLAGDPLAIGAVLELADIVGEAGSKLGKMLSGRKIVAHPGTPVTAFVADTISVRPR